MQKKSVLQTCALVVCLFYILGASGFERRNVKQSWEEKRQLQSWNIDPSVRYLYNVIAEAFHWKTQPKTITFTCEVCEFVIGEFQDIARSNDSEEAAELFFADLCVLLEIEIREVCAGLAKEFGPEVVEILTTDYLTPTQVCAYFLICPKPSRPSPPILPPVSPPTPISKPPSSTSRYFLHLTDIHFDALYKPNTLVNCDTPLCCREVYGPGTASPWGEYSCDSNSVMLEAMFTYIAKTFPDIDFILWTGDNPPHDIWEESRLTQLNASFAVREVLLKYFPSIQIYPALGNHESFPVDQFPGPPKNSWLMKPTSDYWSPWISNEARQTVRIGGYYSMNLNSHHRVISWNTQYCDINNFWMVLNETDPAGELAWLEKNLAEAKANGEKVYLIGHIPPDDATCLYDYSSRFEKLVKEYHDIITGQFYGHTHLDDFFLYHADQFNNSEPINVAYIAPSVTTYTNKNPSFRIFEYDPVTTELLDYHQYHNDLNQTILTNKPVWVEYYSAKEAYGLNSLRPSEWQGLISRFQTNDTLFQLFYERFNTGYPVSKCLGQCKTDFICGISTSTFKEQFTCSGDEYNLSNLWPWIMNHFA